MSTQHLFAVACLVAAGPFLHAQDATPPTKPAPAASEASAVRAPAAPLVGVVDLAKAIENYPRWVELQARLDEMDKQRKDRLQQFQQRLEDLRGAVKITNPDSDDGKQAQFQLEIAQQEGQWLVKNLNEKLDLENQKALLAVYEDLEKAVPVVAKARGVSIVMRVHEVPPVPAGISPQNPRAVGLRLRGYETKQVWFASEEVDLTADLIKYMMVPRDGDKAAPANGPAKGDPAKKDGSGKAAETQQGSK